MGRQQEAILASEIVYNRSLTAFDKSASLSMKGDAYVSLGDIDKALECYTNALELTKYKVNAYLPITECHKEKGTFSKSDWSNLLLKMESSVDDFKKKKYITKAVLADLQSSYLCPEKDKKGPTLSSDIYWAMYTAADKGDLFILIYTHCFVFLFLIYSLFTSLLFIYIFISY